MWISYVTFITKNNSTTRPKTSQICQSPMVDFQYKESEKLSQRKESQMMTYSINVNDLVWCDKCTNEVIAIDGEEQGPICSTCQTGFYLETL
jgi:hypothetical protein